MSACWLADNSIQLKAPLCLALWLECRLAMHKGCDLSVVAQGSGTTCGHLLRVRPSLSCLISCHSLAVQYNKTMKSSKKRNFNIQIKGPETFLKR